jgi:hypothetical protein
MRDAVVPKKSLLRSQVGILIRVLAWVPADKQKSKCIACRLFPRCDKLVANNRRFFGVASDGVLGRYYWM